MECFWILLKVFGPLEVSSTFWKASRQIYRRLESFRIFCLKVVKNIRLQELFREKWQNTIGLK